MLQPVWLLPALPPVPVLALLLLLPPPTLLTARATTAANAGGRWRPPRFATRDVVDQDERLLDNEIFEDYVKPPPPPPPPAVEQFYDYTASLYS